MQKELQVAHLSLAEVLYLVDKVILNKGGGDTPPNETPTHQPPHFQNIPRYPSVDPPPYNPPTLPVAAIPPTSQLQRVINNTLQRSSESRMLSETIC